MIEARDLTVTFGGCTVLRDVTLTVPDGGHIALMGPSGCGKTTLLRVLAGLQAPDAGTVRIAPGRMACVFQEPRLLPWRTAAENVNAVLSDRAQTMPQALAWLERLELADARDQYPAALSGGMQQRVAIARALAYEPTFIMMDEPFAALDYFTREQMQKELLRVQQERSASILFVTHSIDEALILGSQIAVIEKGMVKALYEVKTPQEERNLLEDEMITLKRDIINNLHFI